MQLLSHRTVADWLKNFTIEDGIQHNLMDIVKAKYPEPEAKEVFCPLTKCHYKNVGRTTRWHLDFLCIRVGEGSELWFPFLWCTQSSFINAQSTTRSNKTNSSNIYTFYLLMVWCGELRYDAFWWSKTRSLRRWKFCIKLTLVGEKIEASVRAQDSCKQSETYEPTYKLKDIGTFWPADWTRTALKTHFRV